MTESERVDYYAWQLVRGEAEVTDWHLRHELNCSHPHASLIRRKIESRASVLMAEFLNWPSRSEPVPEWRTR